MSLKGQFLNVPLRPLKFLSISEASLNGQLMYRDCSLNGLWMLWIKPFSNILQRLLSKTSEASFLFPGSHHYQQSPGHGRFSPLSPSQVSTGGKKPSLQSICSWWGAKGGAGAARWFQLPSGFNLGKFFKKPKSNQSHPINWSFSSWETMSFGCFVSVKPIQVFQTSGNSGTFWGNMPFCCNVRVGGTKGTCTNYSDEDIAK